VATAGRPDNRRGSAWSGAPSGKNTALRSGYFGVEEDEFELESELGVLLEDELFMSLPFEAGELVLSLV